MKEFENGHERMEQMLEGMQTPFKGDTSDSWKAIQNKINSRETPIVPFDKKTPKRSYMLAASIAALIAVSAFLLVFQNQNRYSTGHFEKSIELPDGSNVQLLKNSSFSYIINEEQREIRLYGDAIFEVEKGVPFNVQTKNGSVAVLGTTFLVECRNDQFNVQCSEGEVEVVLGELITSLKAGSAVRLSNGSLDHYDIDMNVVENRKKGILFFNETPLKDVLGHLENEFKIHVIIPEELKYKLYSGNFKNDELYSALELIAVPMGLSYEIKDDLVEFKE